MKNRNISRGHKCEYKKQIREELLDGAVVEVISKLVANPRFASLMQDKINMKVDTTAIEQECIIVRKIVKTGQRHKEKATGRNRSI